MRRHPVSSPFDARLPARRTLGALVGATLLGALVGSSCTAGDYEIEDCNPDAATQAADLCERLNEGDSCTPWQCDPASLRCVQRARDDDRDGDPAVACGGGDCDDTRSDVRSGAGEQCDQIDNDCNGLVDEGSLGFASPASEVDANADWKDARVIVPYNGPSDDRRVVAVVRENADGTSRCVRVFTSDEVPGGDACTAAKEGTNRAPRQPSADAQAGAVLTAWSESSGCSGGSVYLGRSVNIYGDGSGAPLALVPCAASSRGAWPTVAISRDESAGTALVVWRDESLASASVGPDAAACAEGEATPLLGAAVDVESMEIIASGQVGSSLGLRAPSVLGLPGQEPRFLVAFGLETGGVGLRLLGTKFDEEAEPVAIAGLPEARSAVVMGIGEVDGDRVRVGVAVESGCVTTEAWFAEVDVDLAEGTVSPGAAIRVDAGPRNVLASPAWSPDRDEWLVTWLGARLQGRRVALGDAGLRLVDLDPVQLDASAVAPLAFGVLRSASDPGAWNVTFFDNGEERGLSETVVGCMQ